MQYIYSYIHTNRFAILSPIKVELAKNKQDKCTERKCINILYTKKTAYAQNYEVSGLHSLHLRSQVRSIVNHIIVM